MLFFTRKALKLLANIILSNTCSMAYNNIDFYPDYINVLGFLNIAYFVFFIRYFKYFIMQNIKKSCFSFI